MIPFHSYIFKVASRCNLNCSYCYVYNLADTTWQQQPKYISENIFRTACKKIREHCKYHSKNEISISFHGGEPLLVGIKKLVRLGAIIKEELSNYNIKVHLGVQTNGLLFTEEIGDFFLEHEGTIGVSMDGPPEINDIYRKDHKGKGSSALLEAKMDLLTSPKYKSIFRGILCVVNVDSDPHDVIKYLTSFNPPRIDFLFPDDNYDRLPKSKIDNINSTLIADWLINIFDYWFYSNSNTSIRILENIIKLIIGGKSNIESIGLTPVDFIFIEANGDIEVLDTLKSSYNGATKINHTVFDNSFNEVALHAKVKSRQLGTDVLCSTCKKCSLVNICGGGYLPNRYSTINGFNNPSIYCSDLQKIINHIFTAVKAEFKRNGMTLRQEFYKRKYSFYKNNYWPDSHSNITIPNGFEEYPTEVYSSFLNVMNSIDINNICKILDLGCGNGLLLRHLLTYLPIKVIPYGVDFLQDSIQQAKSVIHSENAENFVCRNIVDFEFSDSPYDIIIIDPFHIFNEDFNLLVDKIISNTTTSVIFYTYDDVISNLKLESILDFFIKYGNIDLIIINCNKIYFGIHNI